MQPPLQDVLTQYYYIPSAEEMKGSLYITWAGCRKCCPDHEIGPRVIDNYKLVFVLSGKGYFRHGDSEFVSLNAGDMFMLFPMVRHHYHADTDDPWEIMWVSFNGCRCEAILSEIGITHQHPMDVGILTSSIQITLEKILKAMESAAQPLQMEAIGYTYLLFSRLNERIRGQLAVVDDLEKVDPVTSAVTFIDQNYNMPIDVETLCQHVSYSRSYLSRKFKKSTGMSIPEYINQVRIQNARHLLRELDLPVQEIATSVGIQDSFYFSKLFKKLTGYSPLQYRKNGGPGEVGSGN